MATTLNDMGIMVGDDDRPYAWLDLTLAGPAYGALDGATLRGGKIVTHPEAGKAVEFGWYANAPTLKGRMKKKVASVLVKVAGRPDLEAIVTDVEASVAAQAASLAAGAAALEPTGYVFKVGCDAGDTHQVAWPKGTDWKLLAIREKDYPTKDVRRFVRIADFDTIAAETGAEELPADGMSYRGYRFDAEGLRRILGLAAERAEAHRAKEVAADRAYDAKVATAIEKARATGLPVAIESWTEECDDPNESCNIDHVTKVARPDGTTTTTRQHTW